MVALREDDLDAFLKRRLSASVGILIHGDDEAALNQLAAKVAKAVTGGVETSSSDDVAASDVRQSPGVLKDAVASLSLWGDRNVVVVDGVDDHTLKAVQPLFEAAPGGNYVVLKAQALAKTSKLRAACESADNFASLALYADDRETLSKRVGAALQEANLNWDDAAEDAFFEAVGFERGVVNQEIIKLIVYAGTQSHITSDDVIAICGAQAEAEPDAMIDAVLSGDLANTDRMHMQWAEGGAQQSTFLALFALHLVKLQNFRREMALGATADGVLRNARPPVFFKRRAALLAQLNRLSLDDLLALQDMLSSAILQSRKSADLSQAIISRCLLSMARLARKSN